MSLNPATVPVATVPLTTGAPEPLGIPVNGVPTGFASMSSRSWSPGLGSVTVALKITDRPAAVPPTAMGVTASLWNCASPVGAFGGTGTDVLKSGGLSGFPSNAVQSLTRPVWSAVRACQRYPVLFARPGTPTKAVCPFATRAPVWFGVPVNAVPTGWSSTSRRSESAGSGSASTPRTTTLG